MKTLLLTGATGFLGRRAALFLQKEYRVTAVGSAAADLTDRAAVEALMDRVQPSAVVHCAAQSDVGACERDPAGSRRINLTATENIARAAGRAGAKLLFCSSDQVYFGAAPAAHTEDEPLTPHNEYGRQKLAGEALCQALAPGAVCLRLAWMYDFVSLGESKQNDFLRGLARALAAGESPAFPVQDSRSITWVRAVAGALGAALTLPGGVYNFGSESRLPGQSPYDLACGAAALLGFDPARVQPNRAAFANSPRSLAMDTAKLRAAGVQLPDIQTGFASCIAAAGGAERFLSGAAIF